MNKSGHAGACSSQRKDGVLYGLMALVQRESRIDQLFIAFTAKRSGIGRLFMDQAKLELPGGIVLVMHTENLSARAFYEQQGFVLERTEDDSAHRRQKCHYVGRPKL